MVSSKTINNRSSDKTGISSQLELGKQYYRGHGVPVDYQKAAELFSAAAGDHVVEAMVWLGLCYDKGRGVQQDIGQALKLYQGAASLGHPWAQEKLGWCYENGRGVEVDLTKAIQLYQAAASQCHPWAQVKLGTFFEEGKGIDADITKAIDLYKKAALQNNAWAQEKLGWCYERGKGVAKDIAKAIELYQKAVMYNNSWSAYRLGLCFYEGKGMTRDYGKAVKFFKIAAKDNVDAQAYLGFCYEHGRGITKDLKLAFGSYQTAAPNNAWASARLGFCYEYGIGTPRDFSKAVDCYRQALTSNGKDITSATGLYRLAGSGLVKLQPDDNYNYSDTLKDADLRKLSANDLMDLGIAADLNKDYDIALHYYEQCSLAADFQNLKASGRDEINSIVYFRHRKFTDYFRALMSCVTLRVYSNRTITLFIPTGSEGYSLEEKQIILDCIRQWTNALNCRVTLTEVSSKEQATLTFVPVDEQILAGDALARTCYPRLKLIMSTGSLISKIDKCHIELPQRQILTADDKVDLTKLCLHELGHALGLAAHSIFADDVMFSGSTHQAKLSKRDIDAINELYNDDVEENILRILQNEADADNQYAVDRLFVYYSGRREFKKAFEQLSKLDGKHYYHFERIKGSKAGKFLFGVIHAIERIDSLIKTGKKQPPPKQ